MKVELENILETLRDSLNYADWDKVENAVGDLEMLQEQIILDDGYDTDYSEDDIDI